METKLLSTIEKKLQEKFAEDIANQGALMDSMGRLTSCPFCKVESKIVFDASDVIEVFKSRGRLQIAIDEGKRGNMVKEGSIEEIIQDLK